MDLFNLGNLTACCTCSRKADVKANGDDGNGFAQRTSDDNNKRGRLDKPQLGGVGIVFQGTDDGGLKVRLAGIPFSSPSPVSPHALPRTVAPPAGCPSISLPPLQATVGMQSTHGMMMAPRPAGRR